VDNIPGNERSRVQWTDGRYSDYISDEAILALAIRTHDLRIRMHVSYSRYPTASKMGVSCLMRGGWCCSALFSWVCLAPQIQFTRIYYGVTGNTGWVHLLHHANATFRAIIKLCIYCLTRRVGIISDRINEMHVAYKYKYKYIERTSDGDVKNQAIRSLASVNCADGRKMDRPAELNITCIWVGLVYNK